MVDYYALRLLQTAVELPIRCDSSLRIPPFLRAKTRRSYWS